MLVKFRVNGPYGPCSDRAEQECLARSMRRERNAISLIGTMKKTYYSSEKASCARGRCRIPAAHFASLVAILVPLQHDTFLLCVWALCVQADQVIFPSAPAKFQTRTLFSTRVAVARLWIRTRDQQHHGHAHLELREGIRASNLPTQWCQELFPDSQCGWL